MRNQAKLIDWSGKISSPKAKLQVKAAWRHIHEDSVRSHPNWSSQVSRKGMQMVWSISIVEGLNSILEHFLQLNHLSSQVKGELFGSFAAL